MKNAPEKLVIQPPKLGKKIDHPSTRAVEALSQTVATYDTRKRIENGENISVHEFDDYCVTMKINPAGLTIDELLSQTVAAFIAKTKITQFKKADLRHFYAFCSYMGINPEKFSQTMTLLKIGEQLGTLKPVKLDGFTSY
jgi:hypothetical protein